MSAAQEVGDLLTEDMTAVERRLEETILSREARLGEISHYLISGGGKRIRPLVALMIFRACGGQESRDIVDIAAALELIHSATLLHDDIIDGGHVRRGRASPYRRFGPADTLVTGDFLFSKAFELCGRFEERIVRWAAEACIALTEGEVMQGRFRRNPAVTIDDYREIISRKTASLFQQGTRVAAYLSGASTDVVNRLSECGRSIGMAFQIIDDLIDVVGDPGQTGKPVGIDLRDGNPSMPIVLARASIPIVSELWERTDPSDERVFEALSVIRQSEFLDQVREEALTFTARAHEDLEVLAPSAYREHLRALIRELANRTA